MDEPSEHRLTLIIPVRDTPSRFLDRAYESIKAQTVPLKVILVDDGSNPATAGHLDALVQGDSNCTVIHKEGGGVSSARNVALDMVRTEFVAFMDADDAIEQDFSREAIEFLDHTGADIVFGGWRHEYMDGSSELVVQRFPQGDGPYRLVGHDRLDVLLESLFVGEAMAQIGLAPKMYVSNCSAIYRMSVIGKTRFNESIVISEDRMFNYAVFQDANEICLTDRSWYRYIQNESSASTRIRPRANEELRATAEVFHGYLRNDGSYFDKCVWKGILECFEQAVSMSVLRPGFYRTTNSHRLPYLRSIVRDSLFQEAFHVAEPEKRSWRLICFFGRRKMSLVLGICLFARTVKNGWRRRGFS